MRLALLIVTMGLLAGCASSQPTAPVVSPPFPEVHGEPVQAPHPPPNLPMLMASEPEVFVSPSESLNAMRWAHARALVRPRRENFQGAVAVYRVCHGCVYVVSAMTRRGVDLIFAPGEQVKHIDGADDWWDVQVKSVGEGMTAQHHVLVTPKAAKKDTRLIVLTTKGAYYLAMESHDAPRMTAVSWHHPQQEPPSPEKLADGIYGIGYDIQVESGTPLWTPLRVWDHGGQTFIQGSAAMLTSDAPVIYARRGKEKFLVNQRLKKDIFVIDRVGQAFELRVGHDKHAEVVGIIRLPTYHYIRCPGDAECPPGGL